MGNTTSKNMETIALTESELNERIIFLHNRMHATTKDIAYLLKVEDYYVERVIELEWQQLSDLQNIKEDDNAND